MADKLKDAEDRLLESLFRAGHIDDDGFSERVVRRIRRGIWLRRLALPVAMLIGGSIAAKPAAALLRTVADLLVAATDSVLEPALLPQVESLAFGVPMLQMLVFATMLLGAAVLGARLLKE